jgi:hypothetical protein
MPPVVPIHAAAAGQASMSQPARQLQAPPRCAMLRSITI